MKHIFRPITGAFQTLLFFPYKFNKGKMMCKNQNLQSPKDCTYQQTEKQRKKRQ